VLTLEDLLGPGVILPEGEPGKVVDFPPDFIIEGSTCRLPSYETKRIVNVKQRWRERPLAEVLQEEFQLTAEYIRDAMSSGRLFVNNCPCQETDILANGDVITHSYTLSEPTISSEPIAVLVENEHLLVVDKPAGMPCHPQGKFHRVSLTELLRQVYLRDPTAYLHPINRLDRGTSGVVLLAKSRKAYMAVSKELGSDDMHKVYLAKVTGEFKAQAGSGVDVFSSKDGCSWHASCRLPLRVQRHHPNQPLTTVVDDVEGKPSTTLFRLFRHCPDGNSLVVCKPVTGRTHQIRVHAASMGFPLLGDNLYGNALQRTPLGVQVDSSEDGACHFCLHALAYALPCRNTWSDAAELVGILPNQCNQTTHPGFILYRSRKTPDWAA